jgi:hypothetical protein
MIRINFNKQGTLANQISKNIKFLFNFMSKNKYIGTIAHSNT